jgi:TRAP-type transport system periplasmic protein
LIARAGRRIGAALVFAAAGVLIATAPPPALAHGVTVELYHPMAADSALQTGFLVPWAEQIAKDSGGRLHIRLHPGATTGPNGSGLYDKVRDEEIDAAWTPIATAADRFPALRAFQLPAAVHRAEGGSRALMEYVAANDLRDRDFDEVRLLSVHLDDGSLLHWRTLPAGAPWRVKGHRIGVETDIDEAVVRSLEGLPIRADAVGLAAAIARGELDGAWLSWTRASATGVAGVAAVHAELGAPGAGLTRSAYALVMSKGAFRGLSDDLKAVLDAHCGPDTAAWLGRVMDDAARAARDAAAAGGTVVAPPPSEERDMLAAAGRPALDDSVPALLRASARELLKLHDPAP